MSTISQRLTCTFFTLFSTILFTLSFPNFLIERGIPGLGAIAIIPLFLSFALCKTRKAATLQGLLFGLFSTLLTYFWLSRFQGYSIWTLSGVSIGYMAEYALVGLILNMCIHLPQNISQIHTKKDYSTLIQYFRPLFLAVLWTAYEYLKSIGFLGFPWALLAHSVHSILPLIQITRISGIWGISFILALCNTILFEYIYTSSIIKKLLPYTEQILIQSVKKKYINIQAITYVVLVTIVCTYGFISLFNSNKKAPSSTVPMLLIQQNLNSWATEDTQGIISRLEEIMQQSTQALEDNKESTNTPELLVWSETSLKIPYQPGFNSNWDALYNNFPQEQSFTTFLLENDIPLLSGTPHIDTENPAIAYNSAVLISPDGTVNNSYAKKQLVPFAEYIPFYSIPIVQSLGKFIGLYGTWAPGKSLEPLHFTRKNGQIVKIGTPICFEDGFPYISRAMKKNGANILVNITNVSWSRSITAQVQQFVASRFRSIETGIAMVRSTNSGVTSLIDPWGRIIKEIPQFEKASLLINVPIYDNINTLYMIIGDLFAYVMLVITLVILIIIVVVEKKKNKL